MTIQQRIKTAKQAVNSNLAVINQASNSGTATFGDNPFHDWDKAMWYKWQQWDNWDKFNQYQKMD